MANDSIQTSKRRLSLVLRILIAFIACFVILQKIEINQVSKAFGEIRFSTLLLAILFFCFGLFLISFRWWTFMRAQKIFVPLSLAVKLTFLGQFFTNFMPSAVGGDLIRAWYISRHTPHRLKAAIGVAADRFMGLAGTLLLAVSSYLIFMSGQEGIFKLNQNEGSGPQFLQDYSVSIPGLFIGGLILLGILFIVGNFVDLKKYTRKLVGVIVHLFQQTSKVFSIYIHHPLILVSGLSISIIMQMMVIFSFWLIGQDLSIPAPIQYYFVFFPMIWIVGSIPISIAGIGILEGGLVFLFVQFTDSSAESVMALALCQRLAWIIGSFPGMVVHLTGAAHNKGG